MDFQALYFIFSIFFILFIINLFVVSVFFLIRAAQLKLINIGILGIAVIFIDIGFIGNILFGLGGIFEEIFVSSGFVLIVLFTNLTFHRNKGYKYKLIFFIAIICAIINIHLRFVDLLYNVDYIYYIKQLFDIVFTFFVFFWLGLSSLRAYQSLKQVKIQPWIKYRYRLLSVAGFLLGLQAIPEIFIAPGLHYGDLNAMVVLVFGITASIVLVSSIIFVLAWMIPSFLKNFLNKDYDTIEDPELNENELINLIQKDIGKS
ncbi:MAG: hypothetical protein GF383_12345 [Candidatus Lokiarchaeota archaeon]|nr:hypothetical protein [Candidatus Lokiarchaeota archaeon]MBD3341790.1 hypothetical protein [Candidatus Lokiarchaeota archaeon]